MPGPYPVSKGFNSLFLKPFEFESAIIARTIAPIQTNKKRTIKTIKKEFVLL